MFTGLIQTTGTLTVQGGDRLHICWDSHTPDGVFADLALGDSVSVDGICLTVTAILSSGFVAAASPETLSRTTLENLEGEARVNLEPSLRVGSKLGGHFVTGHIDGVGYLDSSTQTTDSWELWFRVSDPRVSRYIVPKGSITVNGISLTVADCDREGTAFSVAVIPLTYAETNLRHLKPGDRVNLEGDVLGKYVEKFLRLAPGPSAALEKFDAMGYGSDTPDPLSSTFLAEHGYL
jgi:riboflavin synthase